MINPSHFSLLVIDDEPDLRTLYELTLLREGYDIETAGTVQDALLHLSLPRDAVPGDGFCDIGAAEFTVETA